MEARSVLAAILGAGVVVLLARRAAAASSQEASAEASTPSAAPSPAAPSPSAAPSPAAPPLASIPPSTATVARTDPNAVVSRYGMGVLRSGKAFTLAPLWDANRNTWARTDYRTGIAALQRLGLRYPTFEELDEIASRPDALILEPVTLVQSAADAARMASEDFWTRHDRAVAAQLEKNPAALGSVPVVSIGKHWAAGAPTGRSWLHGWYVPKGTQPGGGYSKIIQNRGKTAHDDRHVDYSSTLIGVTP